MIKTNRQLLVVGGTGRDVGKTEFVCGLIEKISTQAEIYCLKVSSIIPGEESYHGTHAVQEPDCHLFEETSSLGDKDTSRMLHAGACRVFYLRADKAGIECGLRDFLRLIPKAAAVVCESNSLARYVTPALSIMVRPVTGAIKPRAVARLQSVDLVVVSDGSSGFEELASISFSKAAGWKYTPI